MLILLATLLIVSNAQSQPAVRQAPADAKAYSPTLEDVPYPYPVHHLALTLYGHDARMAYMDVPPAGQPNGRTVVLLHGMNFYGEYWSNTIEVLRKEGFRVVVPDQVGFGRSTKPIMPYTLSDMALNTRKLLESLGVQKAAIVGHSMGGMVAARLGRLDPQRQLAAGGDGAGARSADGVRGSGRLRLGTHQGEDARDRRRQGRPEFPRARETHRRHDSGCPARAAAKSRPRPAFRGARDL